MLSLKDIVDALSASWPVALTVLLGSSAILIGDMLALEQLSLLPEWVSGAAYIAAAFAAAMIVVAVIRGVGDFIMRPIRRRRFKAWAHQHAKGVEKLPPEELYILVWAAACKTQVISGPYFDSRTKALIAKGFLEIPPGSHHTDQTPFMIPDHVWAELRDQPIDPGVVQQLKANPPFQRSGWPY